jgi:DnaK suppressor protein
MTALTTPQLKQIKTLLTQTQQQLQNCLNLDDAAAETVALDQGKVGRLSRMDALQQQAMAQASSTAHKQQLFNIARALDKIATGDYGYCEQCDDSILFARLQVQPEADYCVSCLQALEEKS